MRKDHLYIKMAQFPTLSARLVRSTPLTELTKHMEFEVEGVSKFRFVAGQWLSVKTKRPDGKDIIRAYSIASAPSENGRVALCLNRVQDGFMSNYLCDLAEGAEIKIQGPFGSFILRPPLRDTVFIATGTGVAPIRSMLHWLFPDANHNHRNEFWLLFGSRYEQHIYYREEFDRLAAEHANFHFLPTLSRGAPEWKGLRGYVQEHVQSIIGTRTDMDAYICGLGKMVKTNRDLLKNLGWDRTAIRYERYD